MASSQRGTQVEISLLPAADTLRITGNIDLGTGTWNWLGNQVYTYLSASAELLVNPEGEEAFDIIIHDNSGIFFRERENEISQDKFQFGGRLPCTNRNEIPNFKIAH